MDGEGEWARGALDALTDAQHPAKLAAAAWAESSLSGHIQSFSRERWIAAAGFGALDVSIPVAYGGRGRPMIDALLLYEGLGLGSDDAGLVFALGSHLFATQQALLVAGSEQQKARWLPDMCTGDLIGCFAMSEPGAGSDIASIACAAEAQDDGSYRINGTKTWVTLGPVADVAIVFATTDARLGRWGITAFVVPTDRDGVTVGETIGKAGLDSCPFNSISFDDVRVEDDEMLGAVGSGAAIFSTTLDVERAFLYAAQLGAMERGLDRAILYARSREQGGRHIGAHQAVAHRIADMKVRHDAARTLVYKAGALYDRGEPVTLSSAIAKLATSEAAVASSVDALRVHGARGYTTDLSVESEIRDALGGLAYSGTSDIQRNVIASLLGLDRPARQSTATYDSAEHEVAQNQEEQELQT